MAVRVHRNLNDSTGLQGWVISEKGVKSRRVESLTLKVEASAVSKSTLNRIRTPKGELTSSGARGLGKRTVGAWLVGEIVPAVATAAPINGRVAFHPLYCNDFQHITCSGAVLALKPGLILRFTASGLVEVIA